MQRSGVSSSIWGQQLAVGLILTVACVMICVRRRPTADRTSQAWAVIAAAAALLMLAFTLLNPGVNSVRRWVSLGPVQLHAGFVALPVLIILASAIARSENSRAPWIAGVSIMIAAAVLVFQPDASQAIAFATAVLIVLFQRRLPSRIDWIAAAVCVGASGLTLSRPDSLEAVPYVEGIVRVAASRGAAWLAAAIVALMLLPLPFVVHSMKHPDHHEGLGLAAYFVTVCIASFVAPFPVPILGYGLSPFLGYLVALGWIVRTDALRSLKTTAGTGGIAHEV
jgi:cell division protein FtsW (lipid II flippase)